MTTTFLDYVDYLNMFCDKITYGKQDPVKPNDQYEWAEKSMCHRYVTYEKEMTKENKNSKNS